MTTDQHTIMNNPPLPQTGRRHTITLRVLLLALLLCLVICASWGVVLMVSIYGDGNIRAAATRWVHLHGVQQLWGWAGLMIFGLAGHAMHTAATPKKNIVTGTLARMILLAGLVIFLITTFAEPPLNWYLALNIAASSCLLASAGLFALDMLRTITSARRGVDLSHLFILISAQWLLIWASTDLFARIRFGNEGNLPDYVRSLQVVMSLLGFAANIIFGFGLRLLPGILRIGALRQRAGLLSLCAYNAGAVLLAGAVKAGPASAAAGAAFMLAGVLLYLALMNFLRDENKTDGQPKRIPGGTIIRTAFGMLIIVLLMIMGQALFNLTTGEAHRSYISAWRHLLALGVIGVMIIGIGSALAPLMVRPALATPRLFSLSALLLVAGCLWRVIFELTTISGNRLMYQVMAPAGLAEATGILLFTLAMIRIMFACRGSYQAGTAITGATCVRDVLAAQPSAAKAFDQLGLNLPKDAQSIPPAMSVAALALSEGADLPLMIDRLNPKQ